MGGKSLAKNSFFFVSYKLLGVVFPLITVSYVSQVILAEGVGRVSSAQNIVQYFVLIAALGIPNYGIREVAHVRENLEKTRKLFSELIIINFASTTICIVAYFLIVLQLPIAKYDIILYSLLGLTIFLNYFNVDWLYQGFEEYSYIMKRSFVIKALSLVMLFLLVRSEEDYILYAGVNLFGVAGNNIINFVNLKKYNIKLVIKDIDLRKHFKPVFVLLCTTVAVELYTMVDTTMITFLCTSENVAYYVNSIKIVRLVITLVTAIGGVLLPRLSYYRGQGLINECNQIVAKTFRILVFLLMPCGIGLFMTADAIVLLFFGESFQAAVPTLRIASLLIYALGFSNLFGTQILLTFGEEKKLLFATIVGAITNIGLNALLISEYQQNGAAVASIVSEALVTLITYFYSRKYVSLNCNSSFVFKTILSCGVLFVIIAILRKVLQSNMLFLAMAIGFGSGGYFLTSALIGNDIIMDFKNFIEKRKNHQ